MIHINFKKNSYKNFCKYIIPALEQFFYQEFLKINNKYSKQLFLYIKDTIKIKNIATALPTGLSKNNYQNVSNIISDIETEQSRIKNKINKPISKSDLKKYVDFLSSGELNKIIELSSIKIKGKNNDSNRKKAIINHTFNESSRIIFSQDHFIKNSKKIMGNIFIYFYNSKWDRINEFGRYDFIRSLKLPTCPYCNRSYTFIVETDTGKLRPELDHFLPKSEFPYLAMSYFNLIPSCPPCNHLKSAKVDNKMVNPYVPLTETNAINFTINVIDIDFMDIKKEKFNFDSFEIDFKDTENKNITIFELKSLYEEHKDIVLDLLIKYKFFPTSYIQYLKNYNFSSEEIYRVLFNNYYRNEDLSKRILSKLTKDIAVELKLGHL